MEDSVFLHVCCGPCAAYPLEFFREQRPGLKVQLWFHNPNIHPKSEWGRRRDSLAYLAAVSGLSVDFSSPYDPKSFLAELAKVPESPDRCRLCYRLRFEAAASEASGRGFKCFGTTLAFSKRQRHDLIVEEGRRAAEGQGLEFYYEDWRPGWQRGHEIAKALNLYRQNYCGCIYSEFER